MEKPCYVALKLPNAFEGLEIIIFNKTEGELRLMQDKAFWDETKKKWVVNIYLVKPDDHLRLRRGA